MSKTVALVVGGVGELGRAISERLANDGCAVAVMDIAALSDAARQWQQDAKAAGLDVSLFEGDVTDYDSCAKAIQAVEETVGAVGILVNCAGITRDASFRKLDVEQWNAVLTTNLDSVFNVTKHVVEGMTTRGYGRIINISSLNGVKGQFGQTNYSAAKAGMHGFTMALAQEVAARGVTVNTVAPGYMATKMVMAVPKEVRERIVAQIPVGRLGKPEEIAAAVGFLASEAAAFVTGAIFNINGGQHMH